MKIIIYLISAILFTSLVSCSSRNEQLISKIDSLQTRLDNSYKPGFGEFMSNIQVHHAKLWFAGQNENWDLANFEVSEIKETLENIQKFQKERKESQMVIMLNPILDSVSYAIKDKNLLNFSEKFRSLTNTCNTCHRLVNYSFNNVKIPDKPPFSNQNFKAESK